MRLTRPSIYNQKVRTLCKESMFGQSGGFDQCKEGIRKWLKTSQGFKLIINFSITRYCTTRADLGPKLCITTT